MICPPYAQRHPHYKEEGAVLKEARLPLARLTQLRHHQFTRKLLAGLVCRLPTRAQRYAQNPCTTVEMTCPPYAQRHPHYKEEGAVLKEARLLLHD